MYASETGMDVASFAFKHGKTMQNDVYVMCAALMTTKQMWN